MKKNLLFLLFFLPCLSLAQTNVTLSGNGSDDDGLRDENPLPRVTYDDNTVRHVPTNKTKDDKMG